MNFNMNNGELNPENEKTLNIAAAGVGVVKYLVAAGVMLYILFGNRLLDKFEETGDQVMMTAAGAMKIMLAAFLVMCVAALVQNLILLIILLKGDQETDFGMRFIKISGVIQQSAGNVIQFVMGALFAVVGIWSMTGADGMVKEGDEKGFLIVGAIFAVAGIGCAIGAVIGIIKTAKGALEA